MDHLSAVVVNFLSMGLLQMTDASLPLVMSKCVVDHVVPLAIPYFFMRVSVGLSSFGIYGPLRAHLVFLYKNTMYSV